MTHCSSYPKGLTRTFVVSALLVLSFLLTQLSPVDALPDLQLSSGQIVLEEDLVYVGEMVSINVTVINIGSVDLSNVSVGVYDKDPDKGGKLLCPEERVSVGAYNFTWTNFSFKAKDEHRKVRALWIEADHGDEVDELNEKNNAATTPLRVVVRESSIFILKVVGQGLFLTFLSLSLLALILYLVGKFINRFFAERTAETEDGPEGKIEVISEQETTVSEDRAKEEVAAVAAAVTAFRRRV